MSASTGAQRALLLSKAETVITIETMLVLPQAIRVYPSGLLFHGSNLLFGILLLRNKLFGKKTTILGINASSLMISYPIFLVIFSLVTIPRVGSAPLLLAWYLFLGKQLLDHAGITIQPKMLVLLVIISFVGFFLSLILIGA
ncbi:hypothetical protein GF325_01980 [Candidatus Bathyarchaeota archaeon]|nr:hypothetical protein [Candidatus Bathyarchaeota archaeon]